MSIKWLVNLSIQKKLTGAILLTGVIIALMLATIFAVIEFTTYRDTLYHQTLTLAKIIGQNNQASVVQRQSWDVRKSLDALAEEPSIRFAYIFDHNDKPYVPYVNAEKTRHHLPKQQIDAWLKTNRLQRHDSFRALTLLVPIYDRSNKIGSVYIQAGFDQFYHRLRLISLALTACIFLAIATALFLSAWFQRLLSFPIMRLAEKMDWISLHSDFRTRAVKESDDEVGQLVDGFNMMLDQLEQHNTQLERHKIELEEQVDIRTLELKKANDKLKANVDMLKSLHNKAQQASRAKSSFLANMSHEIRTPMIGILSTAELLAKSDLAPEQTELAEILKNSGQSMMQLLNDILDFSKIEAGKVELERTPFNLYDLAEEAGLLLSSTALDKGLELTIDLDPQLPSLVSGDAGRLRQVLLNLLGNAVKFTQQGSVSLKVHATSVTDVLSVEFQVTDTGMGISPEAQQTIFQSFQQADNSTTRNYGGTGLGLAIVHQLVTLMDGRVEVESTLGLGSTFRFDLQFPVVNRQPQQHPHFDPPKRILIVTHRSETTGVLQRMLKVMGVETLCQSTAQAALNHLIDAAQSSSPIDMIMADEKLPDMSGLQLIMSVQHHPALLGVQTSLLCNSSVKAPLLDRQQTAVIFKPIRFKALCTLMERCLDPSTDTPRPPIDQTVAEPRKALASGHHSVLVVEDNPQTQRLLEIVLGSLNCQVTLAENGREAIAQVTSTEFALILMDGQMPVMDGYETTREMRQMGVTTPIIALTANLQGEVAMQCRAAGMDDCLKKPFKIEQIENLLAKWLPAVEAD